jgi:GNAT superfamily N-acetyltransferase
VTASTTDLADAAATLAAAFAGGPLVTHVQPDATRHPRTFLAVFAPVLRLCERAGGVASVARGAGVAGWVPAPQLSIGPADVLRSGLWRLPLPGALGPVGTIRQLRHEHVVEGHLLRHAAADVAYLWVYGIRPDRQGEGLGRTTMDAGFAQMRAAGLSRCLLKTETPANVALYRHLGFDLVDEVTPASSAVPAWVFLRDL